MIISKDKYFSIENKAISSTKVRDFLRSKELYYKRYISGELPPDTTPSITLGKLVDEVIEYGKLDYFQRNYEVAVLKRDDPETYARQKAMDPSRIVSANDYARVVGICDKILRAPFWSWYTNRKTAVQAPLFTKITKDGVDFEVCGMLDRLTIEGDTAYIDDLKTTNSASLRSPLAWAYHVKDYGYHRQMANYRLLVLANFPEVHNVVCRHFVIGTSKADNFPLALFRFSEQLLKRGEKEFLETAVAITKEERFIDELPDWGEAIEIPEVAQDHVEMIGDEEMESL